MSDMEHAVAMAQFDRDIEAFLNEMHRWAALVDHVEQSEAVLLLRRTLIDDPRIDRDSALTSVAALVIRMRRGRTEIRSDYP